MWSPVGQVGGGPRLGTFFIRPHWERLSLLELAYVIDRFLMHSSAWPVVCAGKGGRPEIMEDEGVLPPVDGTIQSTTVHYKSTARGGQTGAGRQSQHFYA